MPSLTRNAIVQAFLHLLEERPLSKITVKDIVDVCGINRNTFYYHFKDIPELIEAISKDEMDRLVREHARVNSLEECLMIAVDFVLEKKLIVLHLYNSNNRDLYERELMNICHYVVGTYFDSTFGSECCNAQDREILVHSYRCWCFGLLMDWLNDGLREDVKPMLKRLCQLREGSVEASIARCQEH